MGTRTPDLRIMRPQPPLPRIIETKSLRQEASFAARHLPTDACKGGPEITEIVVAWPELPVAAQSSILMLVQASRLTPGLDKHTNQ